ncbi:M56 family metallopeptidase, partial [uncultured Wocania sp.]|uniref:M56 family metallopeptidase n=1 Tax=uncultured Wocania sp. TaxID=2834404 RepID=UPI0030F5CA19
MLLFILKSSACLAVFMVFYKIYLEKESFHHFKRFYLLGALLISIGIPFITFTEYIEVESIQDIIAVQPLEFSTTEPLIVDDVSTWQDNIPTILWIIYVIGVLLFSIRFILNLITIFSRIKNNPKHQYHEFTNVLLNGLVSPHTFFNYIFLNKTKYEHNLIPNEVLLHEQTHAKQKHALDILFLEVLQIVFWFNPLLYFIKKDIKLNHEFLADQAVLKHGVDTKNYQSILLAFSSPDSYWDARTNQLANAINYSLIKKRFTVMKTKTSKKAYWLKGLLILPILAILIYGFSEKEIVEKEIASFEALTVQETKKGATETMMKEYKEFIKEFEKTNTIWAPKLNRAIAIYYIMTEAQRATVKKYPETPLNSLSTVKPKTPTETLFNSWKNKTEFAIWIDGKHVSNETLNNYKASDFKYYTSSFVYNNARSKKFPQSYQNHLYTKKGFEESYLKRNVINYKKLKNEYLKAEKAYINSGKKDDSELRILKAQLNKVYRSLSNEEIEKYGVKKLKNNKESILQQKATKKEIAEYNKLAK